MSELHVLAEFLTNLHWEDLPLPVQEKSLLCVMDAVGASVGAAKDAQYLNVKSKILELSGKGTVSLWGENETAPVSAAVFLNAMKGHTLELDDVHTESKTHIGTVVVPAAWGMAEHLNKSGKEFLEAVVCGYETMSRIGMALGVSSHRNKGWHVTSTAGTFGAAAACGKLLGLDAGQMVSALGMAGTQSFGTWAFLANSATSKVLHPARAASTGLESAMLAAAGMLGPEFILTSADGGLLNSMTDAGDVSLVTADLGSTWQILRMDNKPYPSCRSTHCAVDAAKQLLAEGITAAEVERAEVATYLVGNKQCGMSEGSRQPHTAVEAKFSTPYTVARALLSGNVGLEDFLPARINQPDVQDLLSRIRVITDDDFTARYPRHWGCRLTVYTKSGKIVEKEVRDASGSVINPLTAEQFLEKVSAMLGGIQAEQRDALIHALSNIPGFETMPKI